MKNVNRCYACNDNMINSVINRKTNYKGFNIKLRNYPILICPQGHLLFDW